MAQTYDIIDKYSFKRLILISIIKNKSDTLLNSTLLNKSFFYLNYNANK